MKAMMQQMARTIEQLQGKVAALERDKAAPRPPAEPPKKDSPVATAATALLGTPTPDALATEAPSRTVDRNTMLDEQWPAPRVQNAPIDPSLKGFMQIPGTATIVKLGGSARLDVIGDDSNNGNPNWFVPSSFPVPGQSGAGGPSRSQVQAKASRLSLELRRPVPSGNLRVYYENDFFGDSSSSSMSYRLRHLYGQAWNLLVGQTFSTFMDVDAFPDVIDYQGPNGLVNARQPQIRYTQPFFDTRVQLAFGMEQPNGQINTGSSLYGPGATVVNRLPDFTAHLRLEDKKIGHLQLSGVYRYLAYQNNDRDQGTPGWGVSLAGALNVFEKDTLTVQATYGEGIARYLQDPNGQNEDAALDAQGNLVALPAFGLAVGFTHQWSEKWRSTISYGYAQVDTEESNGDFAFETGHYGSANLIYQPTSSFRVGLEYLYGRKEVRNGASHDGQRLDLVIKYDFVK